MVAVGIAQSLGWFPTVLLLLILLLFTFVLLAIVCDEALAPTLEELSDTWKIPHDVACATFLAAGSSAPEIAISLMSVVHGKKNAVDISLGTLMGSALIAFTVIPACCILVSPDRKLKLDLVPLARDIAFFSAGLICLIVAARDAQIDLVESSILTSMFFIYLLAMKLLTPFYKHEDDEHHFLSGNNRVTNGNHAGNGPSLKYGTIEEEGESNEGSNGEESQASTIGLCLRMFIPPFNCDERTVKSRYGWILFISIFYVSILSELALYFAEALSDEVGVSHHLTGLVLVALGAQVPDTVASMAVAKHGEGPSSIANAIGSQVLNINLGIGLPFLLSNLIRGEPVQLLSSSDSGHLIFSTVILFLALVLLEHVTLKLRDAVFLLTTYAVVIVGFGVYSHHSAAANNALSTSALNDK